MGVHDNTDLEAKDLPETILSHFIERRLTKRLKEERRQTAEATGKSLDDVRMILCLEVWSESVYILNLLLFLSRYHYQMILLSGSCSQLTKAHISTKHLRIFFTTNTILVNSLTDRRCI